jgi:hypothetical protein
MGLGSFHIVDRVLRPLSLTSAFLLAAVLVADRAESSTASVCASSNSHTLCISAQATLTGDQLVTVTNSPNNGQVIFTWLPTGGRSVYLLTAFAPSPQRNDYSFVWPTAKYPDGAGALQARAGSSSATPVSIRVTLSNGALALTPKNWSTWVPGRWWAASNPVVAAVGDGASGEAAPAAVVASIQRANPALFLYLGDIYEEGTATENLNHYGVPDLGGSSGTLWGRLWDITQPTLGNHEAPNLSAWSDYWHHRPRWTSFKFARAQFFDLDSSAPMNSGSRQYDYVKSVLTSSRPPPCVIAFWHIPPINSARGLNKGQAELWRLLVRHGGDAVVAGHRHWMAQFRRLNASLHVASSRERSMALLVNGAGGHHLGTPALDPRIRWSLGETPGVLLLTLNGAANGRRPTSISWSFRDTSGTLLRARTMHC